jgi:opacity protein-like surface antigen
MVALGKYISIPYYLDAGTGESKFTWQATAGISYHATEWLDIDLVYRYLYWDIGKNGLEDINFSGPLLGLVFLW